MRYHTCNINIGVANIGGQVLWFAAMTSNVQRTAWLAACDWVGSLKQFGVQGPRTKFVFVRMLQSDYRGLGAFEVYLGVLESLYP